MIFENNIHWYMYEYKSWEITNTYIYFSLLLLTLNVPLHLFR